MLRLRTAALAAAANGVVITDREGAVVWTNAAVTVLTGYSAGELQGKNPRILKSGRQSEEVYRGLWSTILQGQAWQGEIVNRRKDGTLYTEEMTITPVRDGEGKIANFIAIKQDVTERKKAADALLASEVSYRCLFDAAQDGILLIDADTSAITDVNPFLVEMLGYQREGDAGAKTLGNRTVSGHCRIEGCLSNAAGRWIYPVRGLAARDQIRRLRGCGVYQQFLSGGRQEGDSVQTSVTSPRGSGWKK